jgi:glycerol-3-phosphate acyltransferase PlsY
MREFLGPLVALAELGGAAWVIGGYLAGTLPSAWLVATATHSRSLQAKADRRAGEGDPHVLMVTYLGWGWTIVATVPDVMKGLLFVMAAREVGDLPPGWLAAVGVALVLGHTFPLYLQRWAGRGLAASAGVLLVLLPVEMTVAGALIAFGYATHRTGLLSTIAFVSVPVVATVQGQPPAFVWMSLAVLFILLARRLEGVAHVVRTGVPWRRAVIQRAVFDVTARPAPEAEQPSG